MTLLSFQKTAKYPHLKSETEKGVMDLSPFFAGNSLVVKRISTTGRDLKNKPVR